jgi:integrase
VNNHLGVLGSLFEDAIKWRYAADNPVRQVKPCRVDRVDEDFDFWTAEESERFLAAMQELRPQWFPFFLTALRTGLRIGELAALRWADLDFTSRKVHVRRSYSHGVETTPKNGKARSVPMSAQLHATLAEHTLANGSAERVFLSDEGKLIDSNRAKHPFWRGVEASGVRRIRIHDLRHSFASQLVIAGESLYRVQRLLGHSDPKMTQRYAHLRPQDLGTSVSLLDGAASACEFYGTFMARGPVQAEPGARNRA